MAGRRSAILAALAAAAILAAIAAGRAVVTSDPAPGAVAGPPRRPIPQAATRDDGARRDPARAPATIAAQRPRPEPPEPPVAEPMIDLPAGPPPEQGAGDDLEESGLPRALFEAKVALERIAPAPARLDAAEARLGRAIPRQAREAIAASFQRHDEDASVAIGEYRLRAISLEEAATIIARAQNGYRREAAAALGVAGKQLERVLAAPDLE
jgi:hypothetical protein